MIEPLPCPFCGFTDNKINSSAFGGASWVSCGDPDCRAVGPDHRRQLDEGPQQMRDGAVKAWNSRYNAEDHGPRSGHVH
jgi:hypothetical protein